MNFGRFNEHYINATAMRIEPQVKSFLENGQNQEAVQLLSDFYETISPQMFEAFNEYCPTFEEKLEHTKETIFKDGMIRVWLTQDAETVGAEGIRRLLKRFPLEIGPVSYIDDEGKRVRTMRPVLIGSVYTFWLEKIGDDWGASSLPKRQHHGVPGKLTDADKASLPWREQGFKMIGESEYRLLIGTLEPVFAATLIQLANSPSACSELAENILLADKPSAMGASLNYRKLSDNPGRSVQYLNHILEMSGIRIAKGIEDDR